MISQRQYKLASSFICGNSMEWKKEIKLLEKAEADSIHFDVMDGSFVPRYGLYPEVLKDIRAITNLPIDVHMMVWEPEKYVAQLAQAGASIITVHAESTPHVHRAITLIKNEGVKAGIALNPGTPLSAVEYVIGDIDLVMLMAINPGIVGHKLIPSMIGKIAALRKMLDEAGRSDVIIEIDGGVTAESGPIMVEAGANMLVCGTSVIYKKEKPLDEKIVEFRQIIDSHLQLVKVGV